jgi:hypothetical protein
MTIFSNALALVSTGNLATDRSPYSQLGRWAALLLLSCMCAFDSFAQTGEVPVAQHTLELRSGYTSGQFAHYTDDYDPPLFVFLGGGRPQTGEVVEHRFNGVLFGASWRREAARDGRRWPVSVSAGIDVLTAVDRLTFATGRRVSLPLWAVHPRLGLGLEKGKWLLQAEGGVLLGRVGYFAANYDAGLFSRRTVVDTVQAVFTARSRVGWANWILAESGYGAGGLLGLANPTWQFGIGTGFGPHSPVAILTGVVNGESTDENKDYSDRYFLQVEVAPLNSRWRATGFCMFGTGTYGRVAVQVAYRLPLAAAKTPAHE